MTKRTFSVTKWPMPDAPPLAEHGASVAGARRARAKKHAHGKYVMRMGDVHGWRSTFLGF